MRLRQNSDQADRLRLLLANAGFELNASSRILDFGCGSGALVYALRDLGLDACGYDIHDALELRDPADRARLFTIAGAASANRVDFTIDADFRLPYPDRHFDCVFSLAVMEHVQNHEAVFRELARVTKRPGVGVHVFPPKWQPIEEHLRVPLGGMITARWWYLLWAALGVRNEHQLGQPARHVAELNHSYSRTGLNHRPLRDYVRISRRHFSRVSFRPDLYDQPLTGTRAWMASPLLCSLHTRFRQAVLLVEQR